MDRRDHLPTPVGQASPQAQHYVKQSDKQALSLLALSQALIIKKGMAEESSERYAGRGVSSTKSEVHSAIKKIDKGLYPQAFCKVIPDVLTNDPDWALVMHADGKDCYRTRGEREAADVEPKPCCMHATPLISLPPSLSPSQ